MNRLVVVGTMVFAVLALPARVHGAQWSDTFPSGVPQQSWTLLSIGGVTGVAQAYGDGFTTLSGSANGFGSVVSYVASPGTAFSQADGVRVRATVNPTQSTPLISNGVIVGVSLAQASAYSATILMGGTTPGILAVQRSISGTTVDLGSTETAFTPGFSGTNSYVLELEVAPNSSQITARAYDSTGTTLLNMLTFVDPSPLLTGDGNYVAGILMQNLNAPIEGTFGNVSAVSAVPEPSTCAMALAGLVGGGYALRRRRQRVRPDRT